jgi:hypothetical protein
VRVLRIEYNNSRVRLMLSRNFCGKPEEMGTDKKMYALVVQLTCPEKICRSFCCLDFNASRM